MKGELGFEGWAAEGLPVEQESSFLTGRWFLVAEAQAHAAVFLSIDLPFCGRADDTGRAGMKKFEEIATQVFAVIGFGLTFVFVMLFVGKVIWWTFH